MEKLDLMRILIVKTSALGDIIHAFPALAYLRKRFPHAIIDWVIEKPFASLIEAHPAVDNVLTIDTKSWRKALLSSTTWGAIAAFRQTLCKNKYDLVFDLQGNTKSGAITFMAVAPHKIGFGKKTVAESINCLATTQRFDPPPGHNIREDYLTLVQRYFNDSVPFILSSFQLHISDAEKEEIDGLLLPHPFKIMVCPGSAWRNKQLLPETLQGLLDRFAKAYPCSFVFVWGDEKEKQWCDALRDHFADNSLVLDKKPLPVLQNIMTKMSLVIAMDSLPLHLAGTAGVPTFGVFGPSSAKKYAPEGFKHIAFQGPCPYGRTFEKRCPILRTCPTGACIHDLSADTLFHYFTGEVGKGDVLAGLVSRSKLM